jgi:hypothetical protein
MRPRRANTPEETARNAQTQREVRAYRKAHGLCRSCGKPSQGRSECSACREKTNARNLRNYRTKARLKRKPPVVVKGWSPSSKPSGWERKISRILSLGEFLRRKGAA